MWFIWWDVFGVICWLFVREPCAPVSYTLLCRCPCGRGVVAAPAAGPEYAEELRRHLGRAEPPFPPPFPLLTCRYAWRK